MISEAEREQMLSVLRRPVRGSGDRLRDIEDRLAIQDIFYRYGYLEDFGLWEELTELYTDDVERVLGGTLSQHIKGKKALLEEYNNPSLPHRDGGQGKVSGEQTGPIEIKHLITDIVVHVDGDQASAVARYIIAADGVVGGEQRRGMHDGSYEFRFRRTPEGWRIHFMLVISGNAENPVFK